MFTNQFISFFSTSDKVGIKNKNEHETFVPYKIQIQPSVTFQHKSPFQWRHFSYYGTNFLMPQVSVIVCIYVCLRVWMYLYLYTIAIMLEKLWLLYKSPSKPRFASPTLCTYSWIALLFYHFNTVLMSSVTYLSRKSSPPRSSIAKTSMLCPMLRLVVVNEHFLYSTCINFAVTQFYNYNLAESWSWNLRKVGKQFRNLHLLMNHLIPQCLHHYRLLGHRHHGHHFFLL